MFTLDFHYNCVLYTIFMLILFSTNANILCLYIKELWYYYGYVTVPLSF